MNHPSHDNEDRGSWSKWVEELNYSSGMKDFKCHLSLLRIGMFFPCQPWCWSLHTMLQSFLWLRLPQVPIIIAYITYNVIITGNDSQLRLHWQLTNIHSQPIARISGLTFQVKCSAQICSAAAAALAEWAAIRNINVIIWTHPKPHLFRARRNNLTKSINQDLVYTHCDW